MSATLNNRKVSAMPSETPSASVSAPAMEAAPAPAGPFVDTAALPANLGKAAVVLSVGAVQGYLLGMAGMFSPYTFRSQMTFDSFILMKVFVAGLGSSMITQSIVFDTMMPERWNIVRSYRRVSMGLPRVVAGCLLIGAGMAVCGSGPTMIGVQLGMGMGSAVLIAAGFLAGAALFQVLEPSFGFPAVCWKGDAERTVVEDFINDAITVDKTGALTPAGQRGVSAATGKAYLRYRDIALPLGAAMLCAAGALEYFLPHSADLRAVGLGRFAASGSPMAVILPSMAGAFIGINQISTRLIMSDGQGGSRSLVNIVATVTGGRVGGRFRIDSFAKAWQFLHVYGGTLIGGLVALSVMNKYVAASASSPAPSSFSDLTASIGFSPLVTLLGAAIVGFGGRLAGGCTCGHGVSGASELCVQSLAGAGAIFAGGIVCALLFGLRIPATA